MTPVTSVTCPALISHTPAHVGISARHVTHVTPLVRATRTFRALLRDATDRGSVLPCWDHSDGNPWLSDDHDQRAAAAELCGSCPLTRECTTYATDIRATFGVFGGHDFTQRPGKRRVDPTRKENRP